MRPTTAAPPSRPQPPAPPPLDNAETSLGPSPVVPRRPLPTWAKGVCPSLEQPAPAPLPSGVEWPLPAAWWTAETPCPDGAALRGATPPEGDSIGCYKTFTRETRGQRSSSSSYPHGPATSWYADGRIIDESVRRGFSRGFSLLRQRNAHNRRCGEKHVTQLADGRTHVRRWDGHGTLRVDALERSGRPDGCARVWDADGTLAQIVHWDGDTFTAMRRRPGSRAALTPVPPEAYVGFERARVREHLARVEEELRASDTTWLSAQLRDARARNLDRLRDYTARGDFPINDRLPGTAPFFIDARGTACAVGHLMIESGHGALADAIARDENNDYLADISTPGVAEWIEASGLTAAEHARIQPSYCGQECGADDTYVCLDNKQTVSRCYLARCLANARRVVYEGRCVDFQPDETRDCRPAP